MAGGVKCDKCGHLHTVITDVTADLPSEAGLHKGELKVGNAVYVFIVCTFMCLWVCECV